MKVLQLYPGPTKTPLKNEKLVQHDYITPAHITASNSIVTQAIKHKVAAR